MTHTAQETAEPTKTTRAINRTLFLSLAVIAVIIGIYLRWSFQSSEVIEVNNEPFPVRTLSEVSSPNGVVVLNIDYCKHQDINGELRISWVSSSREVLLPVITENLPVGCNQSELPVMIPSDLISDQYIIKFSVTYNINPIKNNVENEFMTQPIDVSEIK